MAFYTITKPNPGDLATTTFNDIRTALNSERSRRSQSATNVPVVTTIDQITASYINNALSYANGWNGTSHMVAAGSAIQAPHVHLIIDGLNTAGQWNPTPGANGFVEYTAAGTYNWIVPANSDNVRIIAIGGGGGAWGGSNATVGGGGGYVRILY